MNSAQTAPPPPLPPMPRWGTLEWFIVSQSLLPAILYFPGTQAFRAPIRVLPFLFSLILLARLLPMRSAGVRIPPHPSRLWLGWAMGYLLLMILHPTTNSLTSGVAQATLYFSVMAPVFWVPNYMRHPGQLERLLWILLVLCGVNSVVGVLQVYQPERWMPSEVSQIITTSTYGVEALTYEGPQGQRILRPTGLSDNPGAVSAPGLYAAILGTIFAVGPVAMWKKGMALIFAVSGILVIFLTHVRTSIVLLAGMSIVYLLRTMVSRFKMRGVLFLIIALGIDSLSFSLASRMGGESILKRFTTLFEGDPVSVYYASGRGGNFEGGLNILSDYPLGAGLGRWGMMSYYFGNPNNPDSPGIWAEIQLQSWAVDGGYVLLSLYTLALLIATRTDLVFARSTHFPNMPFWAYAIFAVNLGTFALGLSYTPFTTQLGIQYWFLAGALHSVSHICRRHERDIPS